MKYFSYDLPKERVAQRPLLGRSGARLLSAVKQRAGLSIADRTVAELPAILRAGDILVLNNSRVLPCRFFFEHGGREVEVLLLNEEQPGSDLWQALARPMRRFREGETLQLSAALRGTVLGRSDDGERLRLHLTADEPVLSVIVREGSMPIPGYIRAGRADGGDREQYQTVFASREGSVAAPTAGLHFTPELIAELRKRGVDTAEITLHVGPASFQPVRDPDAHRMPAEWYHVSAPVLRRIEAAKRVVAVGTTCTRTLETVARIGPCAADELRATELFITPGFEFQLVAALMTNFHQPQTSHLLLVAAFIGEDETTQIYDHALRGDYRFLSYGDAMLLERGES